MSDSNAALLRPEQAVLIRQLGSVLLLIAMTACGQVRIGESSEQPGWRRPGPAVIGPLQRIPVPDDGFSDYLAVTEHHVIGD